MKRLVIYPFDIKQYGSQKSLFIQIRVTRNSLLSIPGMLKKTKITQKNLKGIFLGLLYKMTEKN